MPDSSGRASSIGSIAGRPASSSSPARSRAPRSLAAVPGPPQSCKKYLALVWGTPGWAKRSRSRSAATAPPAEDVDALASRACRADGDPRGRAARRRLARASRFGTGRTHQIRVHLGEAGHPVAGDPLYGGDRRPHRAGSRRPAACRPFLHAARLTIAHPADGRRLSFAAPLPDDLAMSPRVRVRGDGTRRGDQVRHVRLQRLRRGDQSKFAADARARSGTRGRGGRERGGEREAEKWIGRRRPVNPGALVPVVTNSIIKVLRHRRSFVVASFTSNGISSRCRNGARSRVEVVQQRRSVVHRFRSPRRRGVILIRQFRYAIGGGSGNCRPARSNRGSRRGWRRAGNAARKSAWRRRGSLVARRHYPSPGFCDEQMIFYRCEHPGAASPGRWRSIPMSRSSRASSR